MIISESSMISMAWTRDVDPQNAKDTYWQKLETLHFDFSDPRSH